MVTAYETELLQKKYQGNIVVKILGTYFSIWRPDSGLSIDYPYTRSVKSLVLNPTQVDLQRANQTINTYSFRIVDKDNILTALVKDRGDALIGQQVEIWVGRITGSFDFADYLKLPITRIKKIEHSENAYYISSTETTDRMTLPVFELAGKLEDSVLSATTTFTLIESIASWPSSGTGKIEGEFFSWASKDNSTRTLNGILRGLKGTDAVAHDAGNAVFRVYDVTENPLDILLKLLISNGGGGAYDTYPDGLGIDHNLIDITAIENLRDTIFAGEQFSFSLYGITDALQFIEDEIFLSCNLRFVTSNSGKISLALLDQSVFGATPQNINEDTIAAYPKWEVDGNLIVNSIEVQWDWDEGTQQYLQISTFSNADSIALNGASSPYQVQFKGIRAFLDGQNIVNDRADRFLTRFATPNPQVTLKTHIDRHLFEVGSKVLLQSSQIPYVTGTLTFATELEVISRGINFETGDVAFKLAFTSYSGIRPCYIAPSDLVKTVTNQKTFAVAAGRGDSYAVGWKIRLWDVAAIGYTADAVNTIASIVGDVITFEDNWVTTLSADNYRMKFADYDEATEDQHRYCFISDMGNDFPDGSSTYRITF